MPTSTRIAGSSSLALFAWMLLAAAPASAATDKLYWTDGSGPSVVIRRSNLDGSSIEAVVAASHPRHIAIDSAHRKVYWMDLGSLCLRRANLDGTSVECLATISNGAAGVALDVGAGKVYWTDRWAHRISCANLDGSAAQDLIVALPDPSAIAVDALNGKMYWSDLSALKIQRANLDGSSVEDVVTTGESNGIALDAASNLMYWTDTSWTAGAVLRSNLDGTNPVTLISGLTAPTAITLDLANGNLYWTESLSNPRIRRANLDGSSVQDVVAGVGKPWGIAIDSDPYCTNFCTAGTTTNGCNASISGNGVPCATASSGFLISVNNVELNQSGIIFYGLTGSKVDPWGQGTSFLCVKYPVERTGALASGTVGAACGGVLSIDWNTYISTHPSALGNPFVGGETVWAQGWFRDPPAPKTTNMSNGLQFTVVP